MLKIHLIPILQDNYTYVIESGTSVGIVDPGEADAVVDFLDAHHLTPTYILITHHHWDHVNGIPALQKKYNLEILGPEREKDKIPFLTKTFSDKDSFMFGDEQVEVIETAGHTSGHICYAFKNAKALFSGDTLFSMGCGRLFEGSADQMFESFQKFQTLPDDTLIYCGHEYTLRNAEFASSIEPENEDLIARIKDVQKLRADNIPTIPTSMAIERKTNPFLRAKTPAEFKRRRDLKDNF